MQAEFEAAKAKAAEILDKLSVDQRLTVYKYFKQATEGDVSGARPGMFDQKGRYKYDAWASVQGMSKEEATKKYLETVQQFAEAV